MYILYNDKFSKKNSSYLFSDLSCETFNVLRDYEISLPA